VYVAYSKVSTSEIVFERSTTYGGSWGNTPKVLGTGTRPCIAARGQFVFACWQNLSGKIVYRFSRDAGDAWIPAIGNNPAAISGTGTSSHASVSVVTYGTKPDTAVLLAAQWSSSEKWFVFYRFGIHVTGHIAWQPSAVFPRVFTEAGTDNLRPSVATAGASGRLVYNTPMGGDPYRKRGFHLRRGAVQQFADPPWYPDAVAATSPGRPIARGPDGSMQYAAAIRPHVVSGPADADLIPILVAPGGLPALAVDADGQRWVSYLDNDTVWCMLGDGSYEVVFAGSSSAVPGQPSIVCYPTQVNGVYVGNVVFPVYDTAGGASKIMYARVDTGAVVLDTIESVANLGDSLPCINVYKSDTLLCTWQQSMSLA